MAVAIWAGGVAWLAFGTWPTLKELPPADRGKALRGLVGRFSRVAGVALVVLIATGVIGAWQLLSHLDLLVDTDYGRALLVKLVLFLPVIALGAYHFRRSGGGFFLRTLRIEVLLMAAVFGAAGFLSSLPPARIIERGAASPYHAQAQASGLQITLDIAPNRVGFNRPLVRLAHAGGEAELAAGVALKVRALAHDMGVQQLEAREVSPGTYQGEDITFGMAGEWQVELSVLTKPGVEVRHVFTVPVSP